MKHSSEKQSNILTNDQLSKLVISDIDEEKLDKKQETQAPSNKINEFQKIKKIIQNSMDKDNTKEFSDTLDNDTETKGRTR